MLPGPLDGPRLSLTASTVVMLESSSAERADLPSHLCTHASTELGLTLANVAKPPSLCLGSKHAMGSWARHNLSSRATFTDHALNYPFASGRFRYVAKGVYTNGPRRNQPCVTKWFKDKGVYEAVFFDKDLNAVDKAQEFIDTFNELQLVKTIYLNRPEVWTFTETGSRWDGQKTLQEPFIKDYVMFNSNTGWACSADGWAEVMQALSHFSYHKSGGQMVLCDLQGGMMSRGRGAVLTDPVINSRSESYGVTDLGAEGISTFFAQHRCTQYCQDHWHMPRYADVYYEVTSGTTMEPYGGHQAYGYSGAAPVYEDYQSVQQYYYGPDSDDDDYD